MYYWMLIDMCLPELDTYQGTVAPNCFQATQILDVLIFFKKGLSGVRYEIHLSFRALKNKCSGLYRNKYTVRASIAPKNCLVNYCSFNSKKQPTEEVCKNNLLLKISQYSKQNTYVVVSFS